MSDMSNTPLLEGCMRIGEVTKTTGLSKATIYRRIAKREFPHAAIDLGSGMVAWERDDIRDWLKQRPRRAPPNLK